MPVALLPLHVIHPKFPGVEPLNTSIDPPGAVKFTVVSARAIGYKPQLASAGAAVVVVAPPAAGVVVAVVEGTIPMSEEASALISDTPTTRPKPVETLAGMWTRIRKVP